ncbi:MAG: MOSC N-terminal beta barrel domain-containing protein [Cyanobacteria bacterium J06632_3]
MTILTLSSLIIYPIKSAAGISLSTAHLTSRGLQRDRRYMLVTPDGHFITQRRYPKMALINISFSSDDPDTLQVTAPDMPPLTVPEPGSDSQAVDVEVWGDRTSALLCVAETHTWFTQFLSVACQLVYMPDTSHRPTDHGKHGSQSIVSFADAYPYLLLSEASLNGLNRKLTAKKATPVGMDRFRPNLVISGDLPPHAEDSWKRIRIGDAIFTVAKPCARCSIPNVDQAKGTRTKEPSQTLATYRAWDQGIWFGQNLIQENATLGPLRVGDEVEILA